MKPAFAAIVLVLLTLIGILSSCTPIRGAGETPRAAKGIMNLTDWDFGKNGRVDLDGEWSFYWNQRLFPRDFLTDNQGSCDYMTLPALWNKTKTTPFPKYGIATYHLTIKGVPTDQILAITLGEIFTDYQIWINGRGIFPSGAATMENPFASQYPTRIAYFTSQTDTIDIVMHISNDFYKDGGIRSSIGFGTAGALAEKREVSLILHFLLFGSLLIIGIYHLGLFSLNRKNISTLLFGLFCLIIASRILLTDESYLVYLIPGFTWTSHLKAIVLGYYIAFPIFITFLSTLYPQEFSAGIIRFVQFTGALFSLFALVTPVRIFPYTETPYQIFILIISIYALARIIAAVRHRRNGSHLVIFGFLVLFISVTNDILYAQGILSVTRIQSLLPFGLFAFIFIQSYILAKHFSKAVIDTSIDELTQAYNRRFFLKRLEQEYERSLRNKGSFSLLSMDIDHFKSVNDTHGHDAGDIVLKTFSDTIQQNIRKADLLGRLGGEEFSLLLPDTGLNDAEQMAERLRIKIEEQTISIPNDSVHITISLGVAQSSPSSGIKEILKAADNALYQAKNSGRNRVVTTQPLYPAPAPGKPV